MFIVERLYNFKKKVFKLYRDYLTVEGQYTSLLPDYIYLKKLYKIRMGKTLNLKSPTTYTEKLNWLKLYDRRPEYIMMVDKYAVRKYIAKTIGEEYLIALIGCWDSIEDIDFSELPHEFVLKCNHDNGVIICKNKEELDIEQVKKELRFHLNRNYYKKAREWVYKNVKRKIICEEFMMDESGTGLIDYKFFCFYGKVEMMFIATGRPQNTRFDYFDREFNHLPFVYGHPNAERQINKPENFERMIEIAEKLSQGIPHVRVDLYNINGRIYFSELTFYDGAGFETFEPECWDEIVGSYLKLPPRTRRF